MEPPTWVQKESKTLAFVFVVFKKHFAMSLVSTPSAASWWIRVEIFQKKTNRVKFQLMLNWCKSISCLGWKSKQVLIQVLCINQVFIICKLIQFHSFPFSHIIPEDNFSPVYIHMPWAYQFKAHPMVYSNHSCLYKKQYESYRWLKYHSCGCNDINYV